MAKHSRKLNPNVSPRSPVFVPPGVLHFFELSLSLSRPDGKSSRRWTVSSRAIPPFAMANFCWRSAKFISAREATRSPFARSTAATRSFAVKCYLFVFINASLVHPGRSVHK